MGLEDRTRTLQERAKAVLDKMQSKEFVHLPIARIPAYEVTPLFVELAQITQEMLAVHAEGMRETIRTLAGIGWYPDCWSQALSDLVRVAVDYGREGLEQAFMDHFRGAEPGIIARISSLYPSRTEVLVEASRAHAEGRYALSVPVFLAQADGIFDFEMRRQGLSQRLYTGATLRRLNALAGLLKASPLTRALLQGFDPNTPISAHSMSETSRHLNRHRVLHGIDVAYPTEVNSLKALSWFWFVVCILEQLNGARAPVSFPVK